MNISDDNTVSLFKYLPEVTSQFLIQTVDSHELVQVPNICDDMLLTDLEDGNAMWTLGNLPVLLNSSFVSNDQQLLVNQLTSLSTEPSSVLESQDEIIPNILNNDLPGKDVKVEDAVNQSDEFLLSSTKGKRFLTEDGYFITDDGLTHFEQLPPDCAIINDKSQSLANEAHDDIDVETIDEIQSSDISSQETYINVNGLILPHSSLLSSNTHEILFNIEHLGLAQNKNPTIKKQKTNIPKQNKKIAKLDKPSIKNDFSVLTKNLVSDKVIENTTNRHILLSNNLDEIVKPSRQKTVFKVNGKQYNERSLLKKKCVQIETVPVEATQLPDGEEPDSTVANDSDSMNIGDLAIIITAYKCKKCEFSCNSEEEFLTHFKEAHKKPPVNKVAEENINIIYAPEVYSKLGLNDQENGEPQYLFIDTVEDDLLNMNYNIAEGLDIVNKFNEMSEKTKTKKLAKEQTKIKRNLQNLKRESDLATLNIICNSEDLIMTPYVEDEERERKIMRVKRKPRKRKHPSIVNMTQLQSYFPVDSQIIFEDAEPAISPVPVSDSELNAVEDFSNTEPVECSDLDDKQTIFLCSQCADQFISLEDCRVHMIQDHKLQAMDDVKEEINSSSETQSKSKENKVKSDLQTKNKMTIDKFLTNDILKLRKNKCTVRGCPYRFAKLELLARHESCHVDGVRGHFRCPECGELQFSWRLCSLHLWRCHQVDIDLYGCPLCNYKGSTPIKLKNHLKIHGDDREFICTECGRGFKQPSQLRNHRVIHLDRQLHEVPRWYTQKHCDKCGKVFADSKCLKKHVQAVHSKLKPFICNVCGHSCARKAMLQMHLRQHTGEKPYACKMCLYRTGDHNSLRRHIMRHSGVRPYKCPHCDYTAIQSNSYKNHLANKHPGMSGSYSCTECSFKTVNSETFTSHVNDHRNGLITTKENKSPDTSSTNSNSSTMLYESPNKLNSENMRRDKSRPKTVILLKKSIDMDDDETQNGFMSLSDLTDEQTVDTGGITIPADPLESLDI